MVSVNNNPESELRRISNYAIAIISIAFVLAIAILGTFLDPKYVQAGPGTYQNVSVRLNVTNTEPTIYQVVLDDSISSVPHEIVLNAGAKREVICNASASDPNGQTDLANATASIYTLGAGFFASDSNSTHYTNSSCLEYQDIAGTTNNRSFVCRFNVQYFAQNTTWECNITVKDSGGTQLATNKRILNATGTDQAFVDELVAINISTTLIDYGNLSVTETSAEKGLNITNAGNTRTNFTVLAFGGDNQSATGVGNYSMLCVIGNISIDLERYSNVTGPTWANMISVNNSPVLFNNITLLNRTDETNPLAGGTTNSSYWRVKVPLSVGGLCNGTLQFAATKGAA